MIIAELQKNYQRMQKIIFVRHKTNLNDGTFLDRERPDLLLIINIKKKNLIKFTNQRKEA